MVSLKTIRFVHHDNHDVCHKQHHKHDYVRGWLSMLRLISVDSENCFSALAQLVAVHLRDYYYYYYSLFSSTILISVSVVCTLTQYSFVRLK